MEKSSETSSRTLSLQEAADLLDVHYMTMYRYVRLGLLPAHKVGGSWQVGIEDLEAFAAPSRERTARGEAPWAERLEARMVAGDLAGAWSVVEAALASGNSPQEIYTNLLTPALSSIGARWADGELGIDEEHLASAVASRIIGRMSSRFTRRGRTKGTVLVAMPSGERHGFALAMIADVLRGAGYSVLDLGADTPGSSLLTAARRTEDLVAICLSVVYEDVLPHLRETIEMVRGELGASVPIVVGGRAIESFEQARSLGADGWAAGLDDVVGLIADLGDQIQSA